MSSLVEPLPIIPLLSATLFQPQVLNRDIVLDDNKRSIDQSSHRHEQLNTIYSTVCNSDIIVLWLGQKHSPLREALINYLLPEDITLILFSNEEQLWYWLNNNSSVTVASLVIEQDNNIQNILSRSHARQNVRSILVRCTKNQLIILQRFSRSYPNIDGIYDDDARLLIKLVIDLALYSEEKGDQKSVDENNELEAQRNYDRALKLCALARKL